MTDLPEPVRVNGEYEYAYTATQMREYRNQALEEAYKDANMQTYKDAIKQVRKLSERIADLEKSNAQLLEACKAALSDDQPYIEKCRAAIADAEVKP